MSTKYYLQLLMEAGSSAPHRDSGAEEPAFLCRNYFVHVPGIPTEVIIKPGERIVLEYIAQPLTDALARAWREQ